jgi:hypothetical protein
MTDFPSDNNAYRILENVKKVAEKEYDRLFLSEPINERLLEPSKELAKYCDTQLVFERIKYEWLELIKKFG